MLRECFEHIHTHDICRTHELSIALTQRLGLSLNMFFLKPLLNLNFLLGAAFQVVGVNSVLSLHDMEVELAIIAQNDTLKAGPYDIVNCGDRAHIVSMYLTGARAMAAKAKVNAAHGVNSPYGFRALFKADNMREAVAEVYRNIEDGTKYPRWEDNATQRPSLFCVNKSDYRIPEYVRSDCVIGDAFILSNDPATVYLCEYWWTLPKRPEKCPKVLGEFHMMPSGVELANHKPGCLIHELAHLYILDKPGFVTDWVEVYRLSECILLDKEQSFRNPENYAMYASGESIGSDP